MKPMNVYARWRPLAKSETTSGEIDRSTESGTRSLLSLSVDSRTPSAVNRPWTSSAAFNAVFNPEDDNAKAYDIIVAPVIPNIMQGATASFFAYGHSGSGKTHSIIGYDYNDEKQLGLCLQAARQLFDKLRPLNEKGAEPELAVGFSLFEVRKKSAFDLLNDRTECYIREGYDGKTHIRGKTEMLEGGKVRVCPIVKRPCWTFDSLKRELVEALGRRAVGSSNVHDQSSRTHAVLELEIINRELADARQAVIDRQSELVPVGKRETDIEIEEQKKSIVLGPDGKWVTNPDYQMDWAKINAAKAETCEYKARVTAAEERVENILRSSRAPCLGAKAAFVDLAGAEYHQAKGAPVQVMNQTPQERQEGRQINSDLLALKEVIRAWSKNEPRIPFRSSALTMVLREHFVSSERASSAMIVTVSPAKEQYAATLNSLKYGSLVGSAGQ